MADDKLNAGTKDNTPPEAPAPAGKVIDLSSIQVATDHDGKESTAPDVTAKPPEAVPDQNRRGRPPKEQAGVSARKKEKAAEPRTGRPSKVDKAAREEAPPAVRDKVVCTPSSGQRNNLHLRMKILPAHHMVLGTMQPADGHGLP
jgi:hypothetical protein